MWHVLLLPVSALGILDLGWGDLGQGLGQGWLGLGKNFPYVGVPFLLPLPLGSLTEFIASEVEADTLCLPMLSQMVRFYSYKQTNKPTNKKQNKKEKKKGFLDLCQGPEINFLFPTVDRG